MRPQIFVKTKKFMTDFNPNSNASTNFRNNQKINTKLRFQYESQLPVRPDRWIDEWEDIKTLTIAYHNCLVNVIQVNIRTP